MVTLRDNRGSGCATCSPSQIDVVLYSGSDRVSVYLYCTGVISSRRVAIAPLPISLYCTGVILVEACGYSPPPISLYCTGVILVEKRGHSPLPPPYFVGGPDCEWDCVLSLHVVGYPDKSITFLRLVVVASSRLPLVSVGVGLMSVLSMLSPLSRECL